LREDDNWRIVFGFPLIFEVLSIFLIFFTIKNPSLSTLINDSDSESSKEIALNELKKVYRFDSVP